MSAEPREEQAAEISEEPPASALSTPDRRRRFIYLAILGISVLSVVFLRLHSLNEPLEGDEATYMMMAKVWNDGGRPYDDLWDNKPIGTFIIYRAGLILFGYDHFTPRILSLLATMATTVLLAWLLRREPLPAQILVMLIVWPLLSVWTPCHANGANMEVFLLPFIVGAYCLLNEYVETRREPFWYCAVLVLAMSLLIKQVTLPLLIMPFAALPRESWRKPKELGMRFGAVLVGVFVLPPIVYGVTGLGATFPFWQFVQNSSYGAGNEGTVMRAFNWLRLAVLLPFDKAVVHLLPCFVAAILGAFLVLKKRESGWMLKLSLVLGSVGSVVLPGKNTPHYYILILPALTIAILWFYLSSTKRPWLIAIPVILFLALGFHTYRQYLSKSPDQISVDKYGQWFVADRKLGEWLRQREIVDKRIYIEGSHAPAYFYSGNSSASRFHCQYAIDIGATTKEGMMEDLKKSAPDYLILLYPDEPLPGFNQWRDAHYTSFFEAFPFRVFRRTE